MPLDSNENITNDSLDSNENIADDFEAAGCINTWDEFITNDTGVPRCSDIPDDICFALDLLCFGFALFCCSDYRCN